MRFQETQAEEKSLVFSFLDSFYTYLHIFFFFVYVFASNCTYGCFIFYLYYRHRPCLIDLSSAHHGREVCECLSFPWFSQVRVQNSLNKLAMRLIIFTRLEF